MTMDGPHVGGAYIVFHVCAHQQDDLNSVLEEADALLNADEL